MNSKIHLWIESYLFYPNTFQRILCIFLLPFSFIYLSIILIKRLFAKKIKFDIPVVSIGNLIVGGSGKTPITIYLASKYEKSCVILRGYGRDSKGLYVISHRGKILEDIKTSGDEAMLLAKSLPNSCVIVSENRVEAIKKAQDLGCKIVFLDDGFSKYHISKFEILLKPNIEPTNSFCLPSGGYREPKSFYKKADLILQENKDFKRVVSFKKDNLKVQLPSNILLLTAISKPKRLLKYLPKNTPMISFPDHYTFTKKDIDEINSKYEDYSILTTGKDLVKLEKFGIKNLYLMDLDIEINSNVDFSVFDEYINNPKKDYL